MKPGDVLDSRWRVESVLHDGTKTTVVAAAHIQHGTRIALKILKPEIAADPELVERFLREARGLAMMLSDRVVKVFDLGVLSDGSCYQALELVEGRSLAYELAARGAFDPAIAIDLGIQICEGVAAIHDAGLIHRNLEPANVLVTRAPAGPQIKIIDLMFARKSGPSGPLATGRIIGLPPFAAPEQLLDPRDADERSDIWSIGVVLATMMGAQPFSTPSLTELLLAMNANRRRDLSGIPPRLAPAIERCLTRDPAGRFGSARELADALKGS